MNRPAKILVGGAVVLSLASYSGMHIWHEEHRPPILEVYIFNMKSGRSMFVRTPEDRRIVINGGNGSEVVRELTSILPFYSRRIDAVFATSDKAGDVSGLIEIIERYKVARAYVPAITVNSLGLGSSTDSVYDTFLKELDRDIIPVERLSVGDTIALDSKTNARVLFPISASQFQYSKTSAPEVMFSIEYGKTAVTFLGNATKKIQKAIRAKSVVLSSGVLVMSANAQPKDVSIELIDALRPKHLIYSKSIKSNPASILIDDSIGDASHLTKENQNTKPLIDPLGLIADDRRFNLKDGSIKITSDGGRISVESLRVVK